MADSSAPSMTSLGNCFSSSTSLKARLNSFFILHELPNGYFLDNFVRQIKPASLRYYKRKSEGLPLLGACGIGATAIILAQWPIFSKKYILENYLKTVVVFRIGCFLLTSTFNPNRICS